MNKNFFDFCGFSAAPPAFLIEITRNPIHFNNLLQPRCATGQHREKLWTIPTTMRKLIRAKRLRIRINGEQSMSKRLNVALLTCVALAAIAVPCPAAGLPELRVPDGFGVNIHFTGQSRDLDLIAEAGFKFIRMDLSWSGIEREKGVYNFDRTGYDALTEACAKRGIRILYILDYSNKIYESDRSVRTEQGRKAFAAFAEAAAKRYAGKDILWEIWNEPNLRQFWNPQPSADDYCKLVAETAPLVKKADPTGLIVAPATSGIPLAWLEQCFKQGLLNHIDVLSVHPYRSKPPETVIADYTALRELIGRYAPAGKTIPVISGEWGYSNINWDKTRLSNEQQAQYLARMFLINLSQKIPVSIWYDWKNDGTNPNEREHNFGAVGHDLTPKPAYLAAKILASALASYTIKERINLGSSDDFAFGLAKNKHEAIAMWTTSQEHQVTIGRKSYKGTLISMLGSQTAIEWKSNELKLPISQSLQYLLVDVKTPR
jgi:hypothetical protein